MQQPTQRQNERNGTELFMFLENNNFIKTSKVNSMALSFCSNFSSSLKRKSNNHRPKWRMYTYILRSVWKRSFDILQLVAHNNEFVNLLVMHTLLLNSIHYMVIPCREWVLGILVIINAIQSIKLNASDTKIEKKPKTKSQFIEIERKKFRSGWEPMCRFPWKLKWFDQNQPHIKWHARIFAAENL